MRTMNRYVKVLIGLVVVALLAGVVAISVASADTPTPTPTPPAAHNTFYNEFVNKLATILGKTPQDTQAAITQAQKDVVSDAVKQGKITQQQADKIDQRIDKGGFGFIEHRFGKEGHPWFRGGMARGFGLNSVASFLGMQPADLMKELRSGKSLAQVAQEHGKSRDELKGAIVSNAKSALDKAVANGKLTQDRENTILTNLQNNLDKMIDRTFQAQGNHPKANWWRGNRSKANESKS